MVCYYDFLMINYFTKIRIYFQCGSFSGKQVESSEKKIET